MAEYSGPQKQAQAAQEAVGEAAQHPWVKNLARIGLAAIGGVYMLVGALTFQIAISPGGNGDAPDQQTAMQRIQDAPLGRVILAIIALGLFGYVIWRLAEAIADLEGEGNEPKGLATRAGHAMNGLIYGSIGIQAGLLALGQAGGDGEESRQAWTARFMSLPLGRWLVGIGGLLVIGFGLYQVYEAWQRRYRKHLIYQQMSEPERRWIDPISRIGLVAHGIVLGLVGIFFIQAAYQFDPEEAQGLSGALNEIAQQQFGPWLLGGMALGLIAYGIYKIAQGRYHRVLAR